MKTKTLLFGLILAVAAASTGYGAIIKATFSGGVHWPNVPGHFEGMQNDTPEPHLTERVTGWVIYNDDLVASQRVDGRTAILIGKAFAAPGFDFQLNMGNLQFTKQNIYGLNEQNHATIQFKGNTYDGLFGELDFIASNGLPYRLSQSGFQWEMKRVVNGSTALQPIVCSGYWNYQSLNSQQTLDILPPHAAITGLADFSAGRHQITLDSSSSYVPPSDPPADPAATIIEQRWYSDAGIDSNAQQITLNLADYDFAHPGDHITLDLTVKESLYFDTATKSVDIYYANSNPGIRSVRAKDTGTGCLDFFMDIADADLTAPPALTNPDFETHSISYSYNNKTFHTGQGVADYYTLMDTFGGPGRYLIFAKVRDRSGALAIKPVNITFNIPEPAGLTMLAAAAMVLVKRR